MLRLAAVAAGLVWVVTAVLGLRHRVALARPSAGGGVRRRPDERAPSSVLAAADRRSTLSGQATWGYAIAAVDRCSPRRSGSSREQARDALDAARRRLSRVTGTPGLRRPTVSLGR